MGKLYALVDQIPRCWVASCYVKKLIDRQTAELSTANLCTPRKETLQSTIATELNVLLTNCGQDVIGVKTFHQASLGVVKVAARVP